MGISAAIILAAGQGKRMKSKTPKVLFSIAGVTFIQRVMRAAAATHPRVLSVVLARTDEKVTPVVMRENPDMRRVVQDQFKGTGHAVQCAVTQLGDVFADSSDRQSHDPVLVLAGDMPLLDADTLTAFINNYSQSGSVASVLTTRLSNPFGYGRIVRENGNVTGIVEERDASDDQRKIAEVNTSIYLFDPQILKQGLQTLTSDNDQHELYLTDVISYAAKHGHVTSFEAPDPLTVGGVNDRVQLADLARRYNRRICEKWMRAGVSIQDPQTTWIDDTVRLSQDVTILPGSFLHGSTVVEEDAVVGPYTTLIDATVHEGAVVERARVQETQIGKGATIGPWTYLRPGNVLADHTKAGAFVEMKKAHVDENTKVPHLIYLGDTHIEHDSNVGGGTITANYDGKSKHRTHIGAGVHVGAGNLFVAPVSVGDNVTTGAGSVIRHDVSDGSLVFSENTQHEVKNWLPRYKRSDANWDYTNGRPKADEKPGADAGDSAWKSDEGTADDSQAPGADEKNK